MKIKEIPEGQESRAPQESRGIGQIGKRSMQGTQDFVDKAKDVPEEELNLQKIPEEQVEAKLRRKSLWKDDQGKIIEPKGKEGRGADYEKLKDANIDNTFKTIDDFNPDTKTATSLKTIDLNSESYQNNPSQVEGKLKNYIDELANYEDTTSTQNGRRIRVLREEIENFCLSTGIPKDSSGGEYQEILKNCSTYARSKNVDLILEEVP
jgi:hypothetical protein